MKNWYDDMKSIAILFMAVTIWMGINIWFTNWNVSGDFIANLVPSVKVVNIIRRYFKIVRPLLAGLWGGYAIASADRIYDIAKSEYKSKTTKG